MRILLVLLVVLFNQLGQAQASGTLVVDGGRHHRGGYAEVSVGPDRYYYNEGVFYTGSPDHYVAVEAPEGAVVYTVPYGYERVIIEGIPYYRYRDVYYQRVGHGYRVFRPRGHGRWHDRDRHERWEGHREH